MGDTREIDAFDTIANIFTSYLARALVWFLCGYVSIGVGSFALGMNDSPSVWHALIELPWDWLGIIFASLFNPIGWFYLPLFVFGGVAFISTDDWCEPLFFWHLIVSPWAVLTVSWKASGGGVASPEWTWVFLPLWSLAAVLAWVLYSRMTAEAPYVPRETMEGAAFHGSFIAQLPVKFPEIRYMENVPPPNPEKVRLPSVAELRESLELGPEPPPDIDTANLK